MVLVDTNILTALADASHPRHGEAAEALVRLRRADELLVIVPQVQYEFWVVCTRPAEANGLGMTPGEARETVDGFCATFLLVEDAPDLAAVWRDLVTRHAVSGKPAHDARLAAAMVSHGLGRLLTFNVRDFRRYGSLAVVAPADALAAE